MIKKGFTLAEVLISLSIIGIVAAITIPSLMQNIEEKHWEAKRKALLSRMSLAVSSMSEISGYGLADDTIDTASESFVVDGLSKIYKIKVICPITSFDKCGVSKTYLNLNGISKTLPADISSFNSAKANGHIITATKPVAFQTTNGESLVVYYNPDCAPSLPSATSRYPKDTVCANFIYDLNGLQEPNEMGKDMGVMGIVYDTYQEPEVVMANVYYQSSGNAPSYADNGADAASLCKNESPELRLPNISEGIIASFNHSYLANNYPGITGTINTPGKSGSVWSITNGIANSIPRTTAQYTLCVKD